MNIHEYEAKEILGKYNIPIPPYGVVSHIHEVDKIIKQLKLRRPIYRNTAAYGHFGRNEKGFTWEVLDKTADLRKGL